MSRPDIETTKIEPAFDFDATGNMPCVCVICKECHAAHALQFGGFRWLQVTLNDADLRKVVIAWGRVPEAIRRATLALGEFPTIEDILTAASSRI